MIFARWVFRIAGIIGLLGVAPMYLMEDIIGREQPPAITHPEYFYGFIGVVLAWQVAFIIMSFDPIRYRPLMPAAMIEKFTFVTAAVVLLFQNRIPLPVFGASMVDLVLGILFVVAYVRTSSAAK